MNICIVCGARPNFIKVAPLVRTIEKRQHEGADIHYDLLYTGSSDDKTIEGTLFDDLCIPHPTVCLGVTCSNLNELTGQVMQSFELYLQQHTTDIVVVVDDLASTMAVAIVTKKRGIRLAHIAAGTRSFDINMPKEVNRLVIDGLSDILFTAGASNNSIANREGAELSKVYMVGNILMDNLRFIHEQTASQEYKDADIEAKINTCLKGLEIKGSEIICNGDAKTAKDYIVFTLNRKALIANEANLQAMVKAIVHNAGSLHVIAPLRGKAADVVSLCLSDDDKLLFHVVDPLPYMEFEWLIAHAAGIITDSGNVAEEATFNHVPCITLNSYTENIETVRVGTNVLVGEDADKLGQGVADIAAHKWKSGELPDRWDGRTAERILNILLS